MQEFAKCVAGGPQFAIRSASQQRTKRPLEFGTCQSVRAVVRAPLAAFVLHILHP